MAAPWLRWNSLMTSASASVPSGRLLVRGLKDQADQQLARLDGGFVAVLPHHHPLHGRVGETAPGQVLDLFLQVVQFGLIHCCLRMRVSPEISVTRVTTDTPGK